MKRIILSAALIGGYIAGANATTTVTTTVFTGKNTGTYINGSMITVNCDNAYPYTCYTITTTTSDEEIAGTTNPGDPVTINPYDQKGNPTQQNISGIFVSSAAQPDPNNQNVTDYFYTLNFQQ